MPPGLSARSRQPLSSASSRGRANMDCPPKQWPHSPRISDKWTVSLVVAHDRPKLASHPQWAPLPTPLAPHVCLSWREPGTSVRPFSLPLLDLSLSFSLPLVDLPLPFSLLFIDLSLPFRTPCNALPLRAALAVGFFRWRQFVRGNMLLPALHKPNDNFWFNY